MSLNADPAEHDAWFAPDEEAQLSCLWRVCEPHAASLIAHAQTLLQAYYPLLAAPPTHARVLRDELHAAITRRGTQLAERAATFGTQLAEDGAALEPLFGCIEQLRDRVLPLLIDGCARDAAMLEGALRVMQRGFDRALQTITTRYLRQRDAQMQQERRSKDAALLRFRRISESGMLGIIVCDYQGKIHEANDAFLAMVGYGADEVLSGRVGWASMTPPEWTWLDDRAVAQLKEGGRSLLWEKEYFRKDGSRLPVLVGVSTLTGDETVAFVLDITERKQAEELRARGVFLEAENRRIQEASRLKSEFLANMSHELRTPLNSIIGFADLLYEGEVQPSAPEHREFLGDILNSGRHLLRLINDILDLAKIEAGKMAFWPEPVRLSALVAEAVDVLRQVARSNSLSIETTVDPQLDEVTVDPARLKQVLYNYLSNALKFTPAGGRVSVRALPVGAGEFRIEVEDDGIGIQPEDLARLFTEFEQLDHGTTKRHGGTGLGLALTKRIVEAQGGVVAVRSDPGRATVFTATFPRHMVAAHDAPTAVIAERFDDAALMLVVEDDENDCRALVRLLNDAGYGVAVARTGEAALEACRERRFDAITLDLLLPDLTGLELLRRLRAEGLNRDTPVIVISMMKERGVMHGFPVSDFLQKPVEPARLFASLSQAGVPPSAQGRVLVVDDDAGSLRLMEATLCRLGYSVACHTSGESALACARSQAFDAVVLDLLMPGIDGFEFLHQFRMLPQHRATPVIVWTTKDLTVEDHRQLHARAQAVFEKGHGRPLPLLDELQALLRARKPNRASSGS
jgi:PAS domain S-box-containing protein